MKEGAHAEKNYWRQFVECIRHPIFLCVVRRRKFALSCFLLVCFLLFFFCSSLWREKTRKREPQGREEAEKRQRGNRKRRRERTVSLYRNFSSKLPLLVTFLSFFFSLLLKAQLTLWFLALAFGFPRCSKSRITNPTLQQGKRERKQRVAQKRLPYKKSSGLQIRKYCQRRQKFLIWCFFYQIGKIWFSTSLFGDFFESSFVSALVGASVVPPAIFGIIFFSWLADRLVVHIKAETRKRCQSEKRKKNERTGGKQKRRRGRGRWGRERKRRPEGQKREPEEA